MTRNLIIILLSIGIVAWSFYVFKKRHDFGSITKKIAAALFVLWLLNIFIPNIQVVMHPLSPLVRGRVIDDATKEAIANCNIKAYWEIETATPQGGHWKTYHQFVTKTDSKGEFLIPRHMKVLSIILSDYGGVRIIAYVHGYAHALSGVEHQQTDKEKKEYQYPEVVTLTIPMGHSSTSYLMSDISTLEGFFNSCNMPRGTTREDKKYLFDDYLYYYERMHSIFNKSSPKDIDSALIQFASAFKKYGDKTRAVEVYLRLKKEFPESADFADREIEQLKGSKSPNIKVEP